MNPQRMLVAFALVILTPAVAIAQEVADAADTFASIYLVIGGVALSVVCALILWGASKVKNEYAKGFILVFSTGLRGLHAQFKVALMVARRPDSPGGVVITDGEWEEIRSDMWDYLTEQYGSVEAVAKIVRTITKTAGKKAAVAFVNAKIDDGLASLEREDKAAAAGRPGPQ